MDKIHIIFYTVLIILTCNLVGFIFSLATIHLKFLEKFKIQKRKIKPITFYKRLPLILFNIFLLIIISCVGLYYFLDLINYSVLIDDSILIIVQLFVIFVIDDFYFYFLHLLMHKNKYILKKVHSIHHRAITPVALEYIYVHPLEWLSGYIGPFLGMLILSFFNPVNIYAFWLYQIIRNIHELDVHSGFKSKISKWIPFWGESEHHDKHHEVLNGNYATTFTFWDDFFNTKIK
tara:strand:+ start:6354 stop:7052 length:699 start_codon:yes stop_codon:yes gene_type:complete